MKAVEELKKTGIKTLRDKEWKIEDRIIMKEGRIYVPEGELRSEVIQLHHNTLVEGHGVKTLNLTVEYAFQLEAYI